MIYRFSCENCKKNFEVEIPMDAYKKEKDNQFCPICNSKMTRVLEWTGVAIGSGDGWFGKKGGNVI